MWITNCNVVGSSEKPVSFKLRILIIYCSRRRKIVGIIFIYKFFCDNSVECLIFLPLAIAAQLFYFVLSNIQFRLRHSPFAAIRSHSTFGIQCSMPHSMLIMAVIGSYRLVHSKNIPTQRGQKFICFAHVKDSNQSTSCTPLSDFIRNGTC